MIQALGMRGAVLDRWQQMRGRALAAQLASSDRVSQFATTSKTFRFFLQSAVLGLGAYLVLHGEMTRRRDDRRLDPARPRAGAGRAGDRRLAAGAPRPPGLGATARPCSRARRRTASRTALPRPRAFVDVNQITVFPPEQQKASLRMLDFQLQPGQALGVIGASASGKSTLARVLTGIWRPAVRLGPARRRGARALRPGRARRLHRLPAAGRGAVRRHGRREHRPHAAEARTPRRWSRRRKKAGAHEMILGLPQGYDTPVSAGGARLSGGQKQRIGLARAFYGDPVLLVLDEPNSNLDAAGQDALNLAIRQAKAEGKAVIIMAHRPAGIAECDLILIVDGGVAKAFGPRDEVLKAHVRNYAQVAGRIAPEAPGMNPRTRTTAGTCAASCSSAMWRSPLLVFGIGAWAAVTRISGAVVAVGRGRGRGQPPGGAAPDRRRDRGDPRPRRRRGRGRRRADPARGPAARSPSSASSRASGSRSSPARAGSRPSATGSTAITFDPELAARAESQPEIAALMAAQQQQFDARRKLQAEEAQQLGEQQTQIAKQIEGLIALQAATDVADRPARPRDRGPGDAARPGPDPDHPGADAAARAGAAARHRRPGRGDRSPRTAARSPRSRSSACGSTPRRARRRSPSCATSSSARSSCASSGTDLIDQVAKLDLRAPVSGIVYGSTADTLRGVIRAGRADPLHRAEGHPADRAHARSSRSTSTRSISARRRRLRFSAFDTPHDARGRRAMSARSRPTRSRTSRRGMRYYRADILIDDGMAATSSASTTLLPGMPVEAFIRTDERSPLELLRQADHRLFQPRVPRELTFVRACARHVRARTTQQATVPKG